MKEFIVTTFEYDRELHRNVIMDTEKFNTEEEALKYAEAIKQPNSRTIVAGDYGYTRIKTIDR